MAAFAVTLERGPIELPELRQLLRAWLELTTATPRTCDSIVLATHEAAANAMVHGQQGSAVTVSARQEESGDFAVEVSNLGGWEEPTPGNSGHGLAMMTELMRQVEIHTQVRMLSR
jgi:anti-sigma regulatory factor (Ser/Thr protein kinase)